MLTPHTERHWTMQNKPTRQGVIVKSFIVNVALIVIKAAGGLIFNSAALLSDAVHSLSDFLSDVLVLVGLRQSQKPADADHPIGHGKAEYVLSMFLGVGVLILAYQLLLGFASRITEPPSAPSIYAIGVVVVVIVMKWLLSRYVKHHAVMMDSHILHASADESLSDAVASGVVIVGVTLGVLGNLTGVGWLLYADGIAALVIALFVARIGILILLDAIQFMLGKSASNAVKAETKQQVLAVEGVIDVDKLTMIVYGHYYQVMVNIRVDASISVKDGHNVAHYVKKRLHEDPKIGHVIVHVNPQEV